MANKFNLGSPEHKARARTLALASLADAAALLKVLQAQVEDQLKEAQLPTCHYGHAGEAQNLAHDLRKIALRPFYKADGSEDHADLRLNALLERVRTEGAL